MSVFCDVVRAYGSQVDPFSRKRLGFDAERSAKHPGAAFRKGRKYGTGTGSAGAWRQRFQQDRAPQQILMGTMPCCRVFP
jgi:hypothetical protein